MTYEELIKNYPIGKVLYEVKKNDIFIRYYYNSKDLEVYNKTYTKVKILNDTQCECTKVFSVRKEVEGYLFDGKEWHPAYEEWDGWLPYEDEELEEFKKKQGGDRFEF